MYKIFTLAAAVAVMPTSHLPYKTDHIAASNVENSVLGFPYRNTFPSCLTPTTQKTAEPYSQDWLGEAQENIRKSEYNFKWDEKLKAYCTPNRKNNLRFFYDDKGFSVEPRTTKIPIGDYDPMKRPDEMKYKTLPNWKIKFNLDKKQVGKGTWKITENKAEYIANNIIVQYLNNEEGMRQNFIVNSPLSKTNSLNINFRIRSNLKQSMQDNRLQFTHKKSGAVLNYERLKVWDANGKELNATIKKNKRNRYSLNVNTTAAVYPITIDPISTTPAVMVESNQASALFGRFVASAGDVNGDGYSDVIVGAWQFDNGQVNEGAAFVYHGSATGISSTVAAMVESNQANAAFGIFVSSAGDVNGDGYSDVVVGASAFDNGQTDEGAAFVYHGSATGISTIAAAMVESNQANAELAEAAGAGDVNGDGYSDIIVGAFHFDNGQTDEGVAFVYHGSATGINTTAAAMVESNQTNAYFGYFVAGAGDVNGDGYSDVFVGAFAFDNGQTDEGAAFVYHGSATGISTTAAVMLESNQAGAQFGISVAGAGDVNGDGYSDVIVGAYFFDNGQTDEGAAFVYHGSPIGVSTSIATTVESNQATAWFGIYVACAGDVNGDGYGDIIVGAYAFDNGQTDEGVAFVYLGTATGIPTTSAAMVESNQASAYFGCSVASAGDVNGDGYSDVIVGAYYFDNGQTDEGVAFVYHGSASGINTTASTMVESNQAIAYMGTSVASAGDVNGDGYSDVIVGAWNYDNGQADEGAAFIYHGSANGISTAAAAQLEMNQATSYFGWCVGYAGDVNADGYNDVIVGAYNYTNGQGNEGAAFVYHGSATGISTTPAAMVESNQATAFLGYCVATAGDVNGDGYSDVIAGAINYDNGQSNEGGAFIYYGSATGISLTAAAILESNQISASMGMSVGSSGDVNGDGYSDVIVGAPFYDNGQTDEGVAFVYHGSAAGISTTPAIMVEKNQAGARMGRSVAGAGDVNGDGYSDVVIGAQLYDNGQTDEGAAFIYHGSPTGISNTSSITVESNQANAEMGFSVASAGDVNGDGYSDIIIGVYAFDNGQTDEGAAFVYHGSSSGINSTAAAVVESNQTGAAMGFSVASAGDANADGYSDVIVGATYYDNGQTDEGAAFIYEGNRTGANKRNNLRLYNSDLTTSVNSSNFIFGNFGAGLYARSFLGRAKGKLVWETRLNYNAYSGTPITNSTFYTAQQASYTDMGLAGIELKNIITKILGGKYTKLRTRIKYNPVTAITGQVYSPWRNVSSIIDANNLGVLPIELISFNAAWQQKGKIAKLDFKTDKESSICCFDIEKSLDGFNFYSIGTLPAKNISGIQSYSFVDNNAVNKKQFYRIKIKGIAGQIDYSNIQQLRNNGTTEILVFPNPTTDVLQLQLNVVYDKMNVQIVNVSGQIVKQLNGLAATNQTLIIPVKNLPDGRYWLRLQSGDDKQVLQFIKQ